MLLERIIYYISFTKISRGNFVLAKTYLVICEVASREVYIIMRLQKLRLWPLHGPISRQLLVFTTLEGGEIKFSSWLAALVRPSRASQISKPKNGGGRLGVFFLLVSQIWFDLKRWYRYWASPWRETYWVIANEKDAPRSMERQTRRFSFVGF